jgi:hypothetical protein
MDDQTTRVDTGSGAGTGDRTAYAGQPAGNYGEYYGATQYVDPNKATPPRGQPINQPPAQPAPASWGGPTPGGGAQTVLIPTGPRPEPSFAWLVLVASAADSSSVGRIYEVRKSGVTSVGRVQGNDIVIPDQACSSQHAKIRLETDEEGAETYVIYDLASTNGTFVGSKETYKDDASRVYRHTLQDGDYLLLGETTLVFKRI